MLAILSLFLSQSKTSEVKSVVVEIKPYPQGLVNSCRKLPSFIKGLKMEAPSLDSTQAKGSMGLVIRDISKKNKIWQHSSWQQTGFIGSFDRDKEGNIFVSPLPNISLLKNPAETQNRLYKIDKDTAEMTLFMELPAHNFPNSKNPFGIMAMAFDCDTESLYVSSIAGSGPKRENGVIYQIDLKTKKIMSRLENTDAFGLNVFNHKKAKKLYFGSAREPHIFSVELNKEGKLIGQKNYELSLTELQGGDTTVVKKISFGTIKKQYVMNIKETEFGFRLFANNKLFEKTYVFALNQDTNDWSFKGITTK